MIQHELAEMDSSASLVFEDGAVRFSQANVDLAASGIIFTDLQTALQQHPDLVHQYFMTKASSRTTTSSQPCTPPCGTRVRLSTCRPTHVPSCRLQVILNQASAGVGNYHHTLLVTETGAEVTVVDDLLGAKDGLQVRRRRTCASATARSCAT